MKRLLTLFLMAFITCSTFAQDEVMAKIAERYKNMKTLTAQVTQTKHNALVTKDVVTKGTFYFKQPSKMLITLTTGKDKLLMNGSSFTLMQNGKVNKANGKGNKTFEALSAVLKGFATGQKSDVDINEYADVEMTKKGNLVILEIEPYDKGKKPMFTSLVLTVDTKALELKSLRMNEKGKNYTQYDFSNYKFNAPIEDSVFK